MVGLCVWGWGGSLIKREAQEMGSNVIFQLMRVSSCKKTQSSSFQYGFLCNVLLLQGKLSHCTVNRDQRSTGYTEGKANTQRLVRAREGCTDQPCQPERILKRDRFSLVMAHGDLDRQDSVFQLPLCSHLLPLSPCSPC